MKNKLIGPLKYFTVLFQLRANYLDYLKAIFIYRFRKEVRFPAARVSLKKVKFLTRKNSMDIAHLSNLYEYETTKFILHLKPKIFVDVGAHIGRFSLILAKRGSKVFAYEPEKGNYNRLIKNIKLNQLSNKITPIMKACSNKKEKTKLYVSDRNEGQNSLEKKEEIKIEKIYSDKLDNLLKNIISEGKFPNVVKIDVEGFEYNVLEGAKKILKEGNPVLIIEILEEGKEYKIKNFLKKFGFDFEKILDGRNFIFIKKKVISSTSPSVSNILDKCYR